MNNKRCSSHFYHSANSKGFEVLPGTRNKDQTVFFIISQYHSSICQFPWCKYVQHGQTNFKLPTPTALNMLLGGNTQLVGPTSSTPLSLSNVIRFWGRKWELSFFPLIWTRRVVSYLITCWFSILCAFIAFSLCHQRATVQFHKSREGRMPKS